MRFARASFALAGIYGLVATLAVYIRQPLSAATLAAWWFAGAAAATQLAYLLIAGDPRRYAPVIPIGIASKLSFALPVFWLAAKGVSAMPIPFALIDVALAALFAVNYVRLRRMAR
ncbi:hypothetical protein [uncultured Sphingomonas sp.]|uniref:hypothetical protein n=1 Tax=uncultured Sphingomonas sp. TaxID=158754 RepID=UPI0035CACEC7